MKCINEGKNRKYDAAHVNSVLLLRVYLFGWWRLAGPRLQSSGDKSHFHKPRITQSDGRDRMFLSPLKVVVLISSHFLRMQLKVQAWNAPPQQQKAFEDKWWGKKHKTERPLFRHKELCECMWVTFQSNLELFNDTDSCRETFLPKKPENGNESLQKSWPAYWRWSTEQVGSFFMAELFSFCTTSQTTPHYLLVWSWSSLSYR